MKETIRKILSALANAADGEVIDLPLAADLYTESSLRAAIEVFRSYCCVGECPLIGGLPSKLTITVHPEYRSESRQVIGEFLNFLLNHSASGHIRAEGSGK